MQRKITSIMMIISVMLVVVTKVFAQDDPPTTQIDSNSGQKVYLPFMSGEGQIPALQAEANIVSVDATVTSLTGVQAAAIAPNVQVASIKTGIVVLNLDTGSVSTCTYFFNYEVGLRPTPNGVCVKFGSTGASASGFLMTPAENQVFIINKTTGDIFQCPIMVTISGTTPMPPNAVCKKIGNTSSL